MAQPIITANTTALVVPAPHGAAWMTTVAAAQTRKAVPTLTTTPRLCAR